MPTSGLDLIAVFAQNFDSIASKKRILLWAWKKMNRQREFTSSAWKTTKRQNGKNVLVEVVSVYDSQANEGPTLDYELFTERHMTCASLASVPETSPDRTPAPLRRASKEKEI